MDFRRCIHSFFRRPPVLTINDIYKTKLRRCLQLHHIVFYGLSLMMGSGIYILTGKLIGQIAGASAVLSFVLAGVATIFTALIYAEFGTLIPLTGSSYMYTFMTLGELPAFIIGWTAVSDIIIAISIVAKTFSGTIDVITNGAISNWTAVHVGTLSSSPSSVLATTPDLLGAALILVMTIIVASGAKSSLTMNCVIAVIQLLCLTVMIVGCFVYGSAKSFSIEHGGFAPNGLYGVINGAGIAIFAYAGFDGITNASEEMINPVRDVPRAIFIITATCIIYYCVGTLGLAFLVPRELINLASPFVAAFKSIHVTFFVVISATGTLLATGGTKVSSMFSVPRSLYAMGNDGLIFRWFACVDDYCRVPQISLIFGSLISIAMAILLKIGDLATMVTLGSLLSYFIVGIDLLVMRYLLTDHQDDKLIPDDDDRIVMRNEVTDAPMRLRAHFVNFGHKLPVIHEPIFFVLIITVHVVMTFVFAAFIDYGMLQPYVILRVLTGLSALLWLCTVFALSIYRPTYNTTVYQAPYLPMVPVISNVINAVLILRLKPLTWLRFVIWIAIGLVIYFAYGRSHSVACKESGEHYCLTESKEKEHQPDTEYGSVDNKVS